MTVAAAGASARVQALAGVRIVEYGGIGPGPFACMMLADAGAHVIRVDRPGPGTEVFGLQDVTWRGRAERETLDLKSDDGRERALALVREADGLIEGFRPGVMERLGLGPQDCAAVNPKLVYGRMTGWGQDSPKATHVGHDLNYLALSGVLSVIGVPGQPPPPPINFVGDYGGGGMMLAFGMVMGLLRAANTGQGMVIDAAMLDGIALQAGQMLGWQSQGAWQAERASNFLDGGAPYYRCYETSCGGYLSVAAIEDKFYRALLVQLELADDPLFANQHDREQWPAQAERLAAVIRMRTRDDWAAHFAAHEVCVEPVLTMAEACTYPANRERGVYFEADGMWQPAPAPRCTELES